MHDTLGAPPLHQALILAAQAWQHFEHGQGIDRALSDAAQLLPKAAHPRISAAAQDIAYTALRQRALIAALIARLAQRPPPEAVHALLSVALGQLLKPRHAQYAVVDQTIEAAKAQADTRSAANFINAVLRNALRQFDALQSELRGDDSVRFNLPPWWLTRLRKSYPQQWQAIASLQLEPPPLVLRVDEVHGTQQEYLARLQQQGVAATAVGQQAVLLEQALPVSEIPGFADGEVSVQDAGAQLAAAWLGVRDGQRVLDACAAPGGKTTHLARLAAVHVDAVDSDRRRIQRIKENLARLQLSDRVHLLVADAACLDQRGLVAQASYDRILLDAPCTASGIVRRHPDIPWLRRPSDVAKLATQQARLLDALWPLLKPTGRLLYVVCSLFPEEGERQIESFIARHANAREVALPGQQRGRLQLLPHDKRAVANVQSDGEQAVLPAVHDGFFYALIEKS